MSGLGRGLDRSGRVVGGDGDRPRDGSAPRRVLPPPGRGASRTPRGPDRWAGARAGLRGSARGCAAMYYAMPASATVKHSPDGKSIILTDGTGGTWTYTMTGCGNSPAP